MSDVQYCPFTRAICGPSCVGYTRAFGCSVLDALESISTSINDAAISQPQTQSEQWVCEYSPTQKAFHVSPLEKALESNRQMMEHQSFSGFIPLGVFQSPEEAHHCADYWSGVINGE